MLNWVWHKIRNWTLKLSQNGLMYVEQRLVLKYKTKVESGNDKLLIKPLEFTSMMSCLQAWRIKWEIKK